MRELYETRQREEFVDEYVREDVDTIESRAIRQNRKKIPWRQLQLLRNSRYQKARDVFREHLAMDETTGKSASIAQI